MASQSRQHRLPQSFVGRCGAASNDSEANNGTALAGMPIKRLLPLITP